MMTDPTNHRGEAEQSLTQALAALTGDEDPVELAIIGILQVLLAGPANRCQSCGVERQVIHDAWCPLAGEEQHQSEKFESTPLAPVELDEDNPDTLAEDDTIEHPRFHGIAYGGRVDPVTPVAGFIPEGDIVRALGPVWDNEPRSDFYGRDTPWDVA